MRRSYRWDKETRTFIQIGGHMKENEAPFVHPDEIEPTVSHVDDEGRIFTSKAKLLQDYKDHDFECTWGERKKPLPAHKPDIRKIREDWEKACNDAKYGNVKLTEAEKERCLREEREYKDWKKRNWLR